MAFGCASSPSCRRAPCINTRSRRLRDRVAKADPYAFTAEERPQSASRVAKLGDHPWTDEAWITQRKAAYDGPLNIYEVHLGSWCTGREDASSRTGSWRSG